MAPPIDGTVPLPPPSRQGTMSLEAALGRRRSGREFAAAGLDLADVAQLLWSAQGVTNTDGYRTAASSGATYPLEVYLVAGHVSGLPAGSYRYRPGQHDLQHLQSGDQRGVVAATAPGQDWIASAPAVLVFTAVRARTAAKYPERAVLYIDIEVGHASQNVYLQATTLDLTTVIVGAFDEGELQQALGLPVDHVPRAMMPVGRPR